MSVVFLLQLFQVILAGLETTSAVYSLVSNIVDRLNAAQAAGRDLDEDDWAYIDHLAATNRATLLGYPTLSQALLSLQPPTIDLVATKV